MRTSSLLIVGARPESWYYKYHVRTTLCPALDQGFWSLKYGKAKKPLYLYRFDEIRLLGNFHLENDFDNHMSVLELLP